MKSHTDHSRDNAKGCLKKVLQNIFIKISMSHPVVSIFFSKLFWELDLSLAKKNTNTKSPGFENVYLAISYS